MQHCRHKKSKGLNRTKMLSTDIANSARANALDLHVSDQEAHCKMARFIFVNIGSIDLVMGNFHTLKGVFPLAVKSKLLLPDRSDILC